MGVPVHVVGDGSKRLGRSYVVAFVLSILGPLAFYILALWRL